MSKVSFVGTAGDDILNTPFAPDDPYARMPYVRMTGYGGDDVLMNTYYIAALLDGGGGNDTLVWGSDASRDSKIPLGYTTGAVMLGGDGDDAMILEERTHVTMDGGAGDDVMVINSIAPTSGTSYVSGGDGNDTLVLGVNMRSLRHYDIQGVENLRAREGYDGAPVRFAGGQLSGFTSLEGTFIENANTKQKLSGVHLDKVTFILSHDFNTLASHAIIADDTVTGSMTIVTGAGAERVVGGSGEDVFQVDQTCVTGDVYDGGGGKDSLIAAHNVDLRAAVIRNVEELDSNDAIFTTAQLQRASILKGVFNADGSTVLNLVGKTLQTGSTPSSVYDSDYFELTFIDDGNHTVLADNTVATPLALIGNNGVDQLAGGRGGDIFYGGLRDVLTGHKGADKFYVDSLFSTRDSALTITDFNHAQGDTITILFGMQRFVGDAPLTELGDVRAVVKGSTTWIEINTSGDAAADGFVKLEGAHTLSDSDFLF